MLLCPNRLLLVRRGQGHFCPKVLPIGQSSSKILILTTGLRPERISVSCRWEPWPVPRVFRIVGCPDALSVDQMAGWEAKSLTQVVKHKSFRAVQRLICTVTTTLFFTPYVCNLLTL
jgi:hypothetical protein